MLGNAAAGRKGPLLHQSAGNLASEKAADILRDHAGFYCVQNFPRGIDAPMGAGWILVGVFVLVNHAVALMSIAERLVPFVLFAIIAALALCLYWPHDNYRPFHGTHLDGDEN